MRRNSIYCSAERFWNKLLLRVARVVAGESAQSRSCERENHALRSCCPLCTMPMMPATSSRRLDAAGPSPACSSASGCCTMAKGKTKNNRAAKKSSWQKPKRENVVGPDNAEEKAELLNDFMLSKVLPLHQRQLQSQIDAVCQEQLFDVQADAYF